MQYSRQLRLDLRDNLPADIQSAYLRQSVHVQFHQVYVPSAERTEPSFDELITLCESHCGHVFSAVKITSSSANFSFYAEHDLNWFMNFMQHTVASGLLSTT